MFGTYRAVLRVPGAAAFSRAAFIMRMPIAIYPLALILLISTRTHHYGFAGTLSGVYIAGLAIGGPIGARLVDRFGQRRVIAPATLLHLAGVATMVVLAETGQPDWTLLATGVHCRIVLSAVGALVRARWSYVLADRPELNTAYSMESTFDEVIFVVGPLIATILAVEIGSIVPLILGSSLVAIGAFLLWRRQDSAPPVHGVGEPRASALRNKGMVLHRRAWPGRWAPSSPAPR